jgi:hypothetical protein
MIFDLTDEDREAVERIRKHRGDRSQAETLRQLIRSADTAPLPTPMKQVVSFRDLPASEREKLIRQEAVSAPVGRDRPKPGTLLKKR